MEKKKYNTPEILFISLDNEISLALESYPPIGPEEGNNFLQISNSQDPYKILQA